MGEPMQLDIEGNEVTIAQSMRATTHRGLNEAQRAIMAHVGLYRGITAADAGRIVYDYPAADPEALPRSGSAALRRLVRRGLLERAPTPKGQRWAVWRAVSR